MARRCWVRNPRFATSSIGPFSHEDSKELQKVAASRMMGFVRYRFRSSCAKSVKVGRLINPVRWSISI